MCIVYEIPALAIHTATRGNGEHYASHTYSYIVRTDIPTKMEPIDQVCSPFIGTIMLHSDVALLVRAKIPDFQTIYKM